MLKATLHICSLALFEYETANRWLAEQVLIHGYHLSARAFKIIGAESAKLLDKIRKHRCSTTLLLQILQVRITLRERGEGLSRFKCNARVPVIAIIQLKSPLWMFFSSDRIIAFRLPCLKHKWFVGWTCKVKTTNISLNKQKLITSL